jgi:hypothetical protein
MLGSVGDATKCIALFMLVMDLVVPAAVTAAIMDLATGSLLAKLVSGAIGFLVGLIVFFPWSLIFVLWLLFWLYVARLIWPDQIMVEIENHRKHPPDANAMAHKFRELGDDTAKMTLELQAAQRHGVDLADILKRYALGDPPPEFDQIKDRPLVASLSPEKAQQVADFLVRAGLPANATANQIADFVVQTAGIDEAPLETNDDRSPQPKAREPKRSSGDRPA